LQFCCSKTLPSESSALRFPTGSSLDATSGRKLGTLLNSFAFAPLGLEHRGGIAGCIESLRSTVPTRFCLQSNSCIDGHTQVFLALDSPTERLQYNHRSSRPRQEVSLQDAPCHSLD
jgi:hypothetical protein